MSTDTNGGCVIYSGQLEGEQKPRAITAMPEPKPTQGDTVRRELDHIARQLKGLSDRVKRLKETA